jgi:hypothetical protein
MGDGVRGFFLAGSLIAVFCTCLAFIGEEAQAAALCDGVPVTIRGSNGDDVLDGTSQRDVIAGRGGADTIRGKGGDDTLCGGAAPDLLLGQAGNDRLIDPSADADTLTGGGGVDVCSRSEEDAFRCEFDLGDLVIFAPFRKPVSPGALNVASASGVSSVDIYTILDRSGSMSQEVSTIKNNLATVVSSLQCEPLGTGEPGECIPDLWAGAGTVGYSDSGASAFLNSVDIGPSPSFTGVPTSEPSSSTFAEPLTYSVYGAITGQGGASFGMSSVPSRTTCSGSPAADAGFATFGYPCFRTGALPVIILATDEPPITGGGTHTIPNWATVVRPAMLSAAGRFIGIVGSGAAAVVQSDLQSMATDTGAVDANNGNAPLVFDGSGANAAAAIANGINALITGVPLNVGAKPTDDPTDEVNAVAAFVDHVEVLPGDTAECSAGFVSEDTNSDGFPDTYVDVPPSTPLCWRLVARRNQTIPATTAPQIFRATVDVASDGSVRAGQHEVFFVVPSSG